MTLAHAGRVAKLPLPVLIDIESFRRTESEGEILALLARGEREIAAGLGYDLDEVLAEADALLSQRSA